MKILSYRKKPVVIEAVQLTVESFWEVYHWINDNPNGKVKEWCLDYEVYLKIDTLEGIMTAQENDYIIKGVKGEFYPCKPEIFELIYESMS